jgi:catechol 2,3-dioxygenase-like lactoylglutathione lyase family enzyme
MASMQYHVGRLIAHLAIRVADLEKFKRFYAAVLAALGLELCEDTYVYCDEFYLSEGQPTSQIHLAFQAVSPEAVRAFYESGLAAGGRDNGAPGLRAYHDGYYAAFLLDPDGNNIEAVYRGEETRSAPSIVIESKS